MESVQEKGWRLSNAEVEAILARFPGPVTLYPSKMKMLLVWAICAGFTAGGIMLIPTDPLTGWSACIFFSLGVIILPFVMLPHASALTLNEDGFDLIVLYRRGHLHWRDANDFAAENAHRLDECVAFDQIIPGVHPVMNKVMRLATMLTGHTGRLPDTYGLSADDLADLMIRWRERALAAQA